MEEEKRIFYVAVTRAMDHLFMSGAIKKDRDGNAKLTGKLNLINEAFNGCLIDRQACPDVFNIITEEDINAGFRDKEIRFFEEAQRFLSEPVYTEKIESLAGREKWLQVTEFVDIGSTHGKDWLVTGNVLHNIFEEVSKGIIKEKDIKNRALTLFKKEFYSEKDIKRLISRVERTIKTLKDKGHWSIILPKDNSYAELPIVHKKGSTTFSGRIDRLIIEKGVAYLYDYKTFPIKEKEIPHLKKSYSFQIEIYRETTKKLFKVPVKAFILFTYSGLVVEF